MLKVWVIKPEYVHYDECRAAICVAATEEEAVVDCHLLFNSDQGELHAFEQDLTTPHLIHASFNAG